MLILFDTEFTSFDKPFLLSIGFVTADPSVELYLELDRNGQSFEKRTKCASEFLKDEVLPQFGLVPQAVATEAAMGNLAAEWLLELRRIAGEPLQLGYDYETDSILLVHMLRAAGQWEKFDTPNVAQIVDIGPLAASGQYLNAQEDFFESLPKKGIRRHHALADARSMRAGFFGAREAALEIAAQRRQKK